MPDRRAWWRFDPRQVVAWTTVLSLGLGFLVWSLKAAGVAPMMFPGERLAALEHNLLANDSLHIPLVTLPQRVERLEFRVDTLAHVAQDAAREREALLYMGCAQYRTTFPGSPLPQVCAEVRRR